MLSEIKNICRGDAEAHSRWLEQAGRPSAILCLTCIVVGSGMYGASVGLWRSPQQAAYVALKFPLLILLTSGGNALINGIFAALCGAKISFKQSFFAVLLSFAIASVILGSLSPVSIFMVANAPPMGSEGAKMAHNNILMLNVLLIAFAGIASNVRLFKMLLSITRSGTVARLVFLSWLSVNLLLGGQLSWIMRPFIGAPGAEVQFLRDNALDGNFFEAVWVSLLTILKS